MKKQIRIFLFALLLCFVLSGCGIEEMLGETLTEQTLAAPESTVESSVQQVTPESASEEPEKPPFSFLMASREPNVSRC